MLASLLVATVVSAAPVRVTVEVVEFYTQKPIIGAKVKLREEPGSVEVTATTGAKGKARLEVPHLNFKFVEATRKGYLTAEELKPYRQLLRQEYLDKRTKHGEDELYFEVWLVPSTWIQENVKVRTREQALAITSDWARDCAASGPSSLELKGETWIAVYPCMEVRVNMQSGTVYPSTPDVVTGTPLYPPEEALADALASPLKYVGTPVWPGRYKIPSCVYRNRKVFVVNSYCTTREIHSTGITVFHPEKGSAGFYAEAKEPISTIGREDYGNWSFSTSDPFPGLRLNMKLDELLAYEERRSKLGKGSCYAGLRVSTEKNGGCRLKTPDIEQWWDGLYKPLLKNPPAGWYELVKVLRKRAPKDGRPDPRGQD